MRRDLAFVTCAVLLVATGGCGLVEKSDAEADDSCTEPRSSVQELNTQAETLAKEVEPSSARPEATQRAGYVWWNDGAFDDSAGRAWDAAQRAAAMKVIDTLRMASRVVVNNPDCWSDIELANAQESLDRWETTP